MRNVRKDVLDAIKKQGGNEDKSSNNKNKKKTSSSGLSKDEEKRINDTVDAAAEKWVLKINETVEDKVKELQSE